MFTLEVFSLCLSAVATVMVLLGFLLARKQWQSNALHREHLELSKPEMRAALRTIFAAKQSEFLEANDVRLRNAAEIVLDMYDLLAQRVRAGTVPKRETIDSEWPTVLRVAQQLRPFIDQTANERKTPYKEAFKWLVQEIMATPRVIAALSPTASNIGGWPAGIPLLPLRSIEGFRNSRPCVAVAVVCNGNVLLLRRAQEPQANKWELPGGFLDDGEHPKVGALREVREETEFNVVLQDDVTIFMGEYRTQKADYSTLNLCYSAELAIAFPPGSEPKPKLCSESQDYAWFPLTARKSIDETHPLAFPWIERYLATL